MNVMDLFKPKTPEAAPKTPEVPKTKEGGSPVGDNKNPAGTDQNNLSKETQNPFDSYQKLFDNAAKNSDIQAPSFSLDPKVIADVASKMNFTQGINPELVQKAQSGDAGSMMELIQEVGRNAYRASLEHATKLTDTHLGQRSEYEGRRVKEGVRSQLTSDALSAGSDTNANLNHPVVKAELNRIAKSFAASPEYADASPQEIAKAAKQYLIDLNSALSPVAKEKTKAPKDSSGNGDIDYLSYLGIDS
jgi:hypothetical protein